VRLIPQFLRAWHLELFTEPSGGDFLRDHQFLLSGRKNLSFSFSFRFPHADIF